MTTEMWLIAAVRLLGAIPVLRWALAGALIAIAVDQSDLFMMNLLDLGGVRDYQTFDKYLDQAYLLAFLVVALRWQGPARTVAVALYCYRLAGFAVFELTHERDVLLLFPNFFEYWLILIAALKHYRIDPFARPDAADTADESVLDPAWRYASAGALPQTAAPEIVIIEAGTRRMSEKTFGGIVVALVALKLFQEYALHYGRWLDGFTAVDAVEAIWRVLTPPY
ncbi:MAG: hypothetical protein AB7P33_10405 [Dehalococcoidia bacterium]